MNPYSNNELYIPQIKTLKSGSKINPTTASTTVAGRRNSETTSFIKLEEESQAKSRNPIIKNPAGIKNIKKNASTYKNPKQKIPFGGNKNLDFMKNSFIWKENSALQNFSKFYPSVWAAIKDKIALKQVYSKISPNIKSLNTNHAELIREALMKSIVKRSINDSKSVPKMYLNYKMTKTPQVIWIVTTWRSGSTFLGDVLKEIPGSFYTFEPLLHLTNNNGIDQNTLNRSLDIIQSLGHCNYTDLQDYLKFERKLTMTKSRHSWMLVHNERALKPCENLGPICVDADFMSESCELFPMRITKTVRLSLMQASNMLYNSTMNVKIINLVRDPRGVYNSRKKLPWCKSEACKNMTYHCQRLEDDLEFATGLQKEFPENYRLLRYEDLCKHPVNILKDLLGFLQVPYLKVLQEFVKYHTSGVKVGKSKHSTFRNSMDTYAKWKKELSKAQIQSIQNQCSDPLKTLGYEFL